MIAHRQLQVCYAMAETVFAVSQTAVGKPSRTLEIDTNSLHQDGVAKDANGGNAKRISSTGPILPGLSVTIRRDDQPVPDGHVGEIAIAGDFLFRGYHNDPLKTAERIRDNTYYTRDLGFMRDGELYVLGRKDDLLIINGRNLHAHEVEQIINAVPGTKAGRNVAFGLRNEQTGSDDLIIVAECDFGERDDLAKAELTKDLSQAIRAAVLDATNIDVKSCRVVEPGWLVKTTSGKISREQNQLKYIETVAAAAAKADEEPLPSPSSGGSPMARIAAVIARHFECSANSITRKTKAADVDGWDSLAHASVMLLIEQRFGITFQENEIFTFQSVGEIADRVEELLKAPAAAAINRTVFDGEHSSILCYGEPTDQPDVFIFAGRIERFGVMPLMDFASLLGDTRLGKSRRFFVTDKSRDWYKSAFSELTTAIGQLSDRPKILLGNSMGGYAAVLFAEHLKDVRSVLAFVPQTTPMRTRNTPAGASLPPMLSFNPAVPYCVVYGSEADAGDQEYVRERLQGHANSRMYVAQGASHGVVAHLHGQKKLTPILDAAAEPVTMVSKIGGLL